MHLIACRNPLKRKGIGKTLLIMKLTAILLLAACLNATASGFAQKVSLSETNVSLEKVFWEIKKQTGYTFVSTKELLQKAKPVTITISNAPIEKVLDLCFQDQPLDYTIVNKTVVVIDKKKVGSPQRDYLRITVADTTRNVAGKVVSEDNPVAGASVIVEGINRGTTTNDNGNFVMSNVPAGTYTLLITHVGFANLKQKITVADQDISLSINMPGDPLNLQQIVVTSTGSPKKKIESSVAITTVSANTLEDRAPLNSADVIKAIPGVMVASSGGDGPGNVRVRGLPSGGGYSFFGVMEDGLPVLPTGFNSVPSADQYFKSDLTIKNIEAIRGGNAPLVMVNTAGALMNNISYTGAERTYGKFKFTTGLSQDLYRVDGNVGGSISKKVKYNFGGFYRTDKGIKEPTYTANKGGQLKANFTWNFNDKGYIRVYTKYLNDKVQWQLPAFYAYNKDHRAESFQGFDIFTETLVPSQTQFDVKLPDGRTINMNLEDGYHTKLGYGGLLFNYNINGWNIKNNFRYQYTDFTALNPIVTAANAFNSSRNYYYTNGQQLMNPTGYFATQQLGLTKRQDAQIINYIDITKKIGKNSVTIGGGVYSYNVINNEAINALVNTAIENQPRVILVGSPTASPATAVANNGMGGIIKFDGNTVMSSVYINDEVAITDKLRLDAGFRVDNFNLDGNKGTYSGSSAANGGTGFKISGMTPWSNNTTYWSASLAANYKVNNSMAFFVRGTRTYNAFNIADFTALDFNPKNLKEREIKMGELGVKYAQGDFSLFSSISYTTGENLPLNVGVPSATGAIVNNSTFASSRSIGWETEATYQVFKGLNLRLTTTFQDPKFTEYSITVDPSARPDIAGKTLDWTGNRPQTTPNLNLQLGGSYDYKWFSLFGNALYQGEMWSTSAQTYKIPAFTEFTGGAAAKFFQNKVELRGWVNNILNTRALTEGNVRGEQFINERDLVIGQPMLGRPIFPRSFWLSVAYGF
jgi:outer membrane cobalamin receptor